LESFITTEVNKQLKVIKTACARILVHLRFFLCMVMSTYTPPYVVEPSIERALAIPQNHQGEKITCWWDFEDLHQVGHGAIPSSTRRWSHCFNPEHKLTLKLAQVDRGDVGIKNELVYLSTDFEEQGQQGQG
jgi:hypothetical protein